MRRLSMHELSGVELAKIKYLELKILLELQRVCNMLGIEFHLDAGTLLGAARHQGFIPWDDDIDVSLLRPDYEVLMREGPRIFSKEFFLQTPENSPRMPASFMKLRLNGTEMRENVLGHVPGNHGIWIDIFPFDVVRQNTDFEKLRRRQRNLGKVFDLKMRETASGKLSPMGRLGRTIIHLALQTVPRDAILNRMRGDDLHGIDLENSYITSFHYGSSFIALKYAESLPTTTLEFEGYDMPVLSTWPQYLTQLYGDWKKLPPEKDRVPHHFVSKLDFGEYADIQLPAEE